MSSLYYIDQPYPSVPAHAEFDVELRFGPQGEILGFFQIGIWDRFGVGISYGASNLIGAGNPDFYEIPGVQLRIVAIEEMPFVPSLRIGFDSQGYGGYDGTRYDIMSKGAYCQLSKSYTSSLFEIVPSIGVNYSLEGDDRFDLFGGIKAQFGTSSALMLDYSPNFDDERDQDKGYLNVSLVFIFYDEIFFEFALRDLLNNGSNDLQYNRMIRLGYVQYF
jgi:hypothetical protein